MVPSRPGAKRILNVVTQLEAGGAQGAALRMAAALRSRGYWSETWFLYKKRNSFPNATHTRILLPRRPEGPLNLLRLLRELYTSIREVRPDAIISYTHYANVIVNPIAWLCGVPVRIATQRSISSSQPRLARVLDRFVGLLGCYSSIIAVSDSVRKSFAGYPSSYRRRMIVVHNGVDFQPSELSQEEARAKYGICQAGPVLLSVGRLAPVKNQAVLIRSLELLPEWRLVLVGWGELYEELLRLAKQVGVADRVHFLGEVEPSEVRDTYKIADVFALTSKSEAFGFAALEAAASDVPVVCSDIPAMRELFSAGTEAAVFVPTDDVEAFADAVRRIYTDKGLRNQLKSVAADVVSRYGLNVMVDGYETIATNSIICGDKDRAVRG